ncbi:MAG: hypothetical protein ABR512_12065, partial [Desulfopila sp.]
VGLRLTDKKKHCQQHQPTVYFHNSFYNSMVILLSKFDGVVKTLHLRRYYKILGTAPYKLFS